MVYIHTPIIVPDSAPTQTRHSRELGKRVDQVIHEFRREYPELTDDEIRAALDQATPAGAAPRRGAGRRRPAVAAMAGVAAALAAGIAVAFDGSGGGGTAGDSGSGISLIVAGTIAAAVVVVALIVASRR
jgi:hypothetical protein